MPSTERAASQSKNTSPAPRSFAAFLIWSKDILSESLSHWVGSTPLALSTLATASGKVMQPAFSSQPLSVPFLIASYKGSMPGTVAPLMCGWSMGSMLESIMVAASASVRATNTKGELRVGLEADRDEALDVLPCGDKDLATHVATLFGPWLLVLNVNACGTILDEHLGKLHCRCETSMAGVGVGNDRVEVVDSRLFGPLIRRHSAPGLKLLPIVEELRPEELIHLVWHRVIRVVRDIWTWLV